MRFWRISSRHPGLYEADDLTGEGARRSGARWNTKGTPAIYASYHLATAVLETLVHVGRRGQPLDRYVVRIDVSDTRFKDPQHSIVVLNTEDLPAGWNVTPPVDVSQIFGAEQFRHGRLGFAVPSAILPEELNLVLNPLHPDFQKSVTAQIVRKFTFDPRL